MNTRILMTCSAAVMGVVGIVLSFMPDEVGRYIAGSEPSFINTLVLQLLGALYFAFAMINWTARGNLIGGIYARPISIGNLTHFMIGALALIKVVFVKSELLTLIPAIVYAIFAICFAIVFFTHPLPEKDAG